MRWFALVAMLGAPAAACAAPETVLAGLNTRAEIDAFATTVRCAMVEPVDERGEPGRGAALIRFLGHPSLEAPPQVAAHYRYAGFPYANWSPYEAVVIDAYLPADDAPTIEFFVQSGSTEFAAPLQLAPRRHTTQRMALGDFAAGGVDLSAVSVVGFRAPLGEAPRPSRVVIDRLRLIGGDPEAVREARRAEDATASDRQPRSVARTEAAELAVSPQRTGQSVRRSVKAPVIATPKVLVVGGGLAGCAAAITAARMGADTLLVERTGSLGGMGTIGLVPPAFNVGLTEGIVREFTDRLDAVGGEAENRNPEMMKYVLFDMLQESGARVMLYSLAVDAVVRDDAVCGIIVENKSGAQAILADVVIDCTGDADIAAKAGAPFVIGRGRDDETQTQTLVFLLGNVDVPVLLKAREQLPDLVKQARANNDFTARFGGSAAIQPVVNAAHGVVNVNSINIGGVSGLKVEDLTYSHIEAQRDALKLVDFYRKYVPGCSECYLLSTAEVIGVRESRRIVGEYTLSGEDVLAGARFDDGIARGFYPIDIHAPDASGDAAGARLGKPYEIPYRCLVPKRIDNLLVAGRPISADHVAHGSARVMGTTMPLGQAAGCAAAMCLDRGCTPRELDGKRVRRMLERLGAKPATRENAPDNLAMAKYGVTASADSFHPSYPRSAENAIDGLITRDSSSRWLSADTPPPHWLELRFPQPTQVARVKLHFFAHSIDSLNTQYVPRGFEVQVKRGEEWVTVAGVTDNASLDPELTFDPVTAQTMRIVFTISCPSDDIVRLREVEVHGR
jgi:hypothetical protein